MVLYFLILFIYTYYLFHKLFPYLLYFGFYPHQISFDKKNIRRIFFYFFKIYIFYWRIIEFIKWLIFIIISTIWYKMPLSELFPKWTIIPINKYFIFFLSSNTKIFSSYLTEYFLYLFKEFNIIIKYFG
jgi:hypothetical protein